MLSGVAVPDVWRVPDAGRVGGVAVCERHPEGAAVGPGDGHDGCHCLLHLLSLALATLGQGKYQHTTS